MTEILSAAITVVGILGFVALIFGLTVLFWGSWEN